MRLMKLVSNDGIVFHLPKTHPLLKEGLFACINLDEPVPFTSDELSCLLYTDFQSYDSIELIHMFSKFSPLSLTYFDGAVFSELFKRFKDNSESHEGLEKDPIIQETLGCNAYLRSIIYGVPEEISFEELYEMILFYKYHNVTRDDLFSKLKTLYGDDVETVTNRLKAVEDLGVIQRVKDGMIWNIGLLEIRTCIQRMKSSFR